MSVYLTIKGEYDYAGALSFYDYTTTVIPSNVRTTLYYKYGVSDEYEVTIEFHADQIPSKVYYLDSMMSEIEIPVTGEQVTFPIYFDYDKQEFEVFLVQNTPQPPIEVSGFNNLYLMDKNSLKSLSYARFHIGGTDVDLGEYIINILELPFKISEEYIGNDSDIELGSFYMGVEVPKLLTDRITIDFGTISIPKRHNNSYDYLNTNINIHLPYSKPIPVELEYAIGYDIGIVYILDLYSGDGTINITSSRVDKVIHSETFKIGRDIPFVKNVGGSTINTLSTVSGVDNGVLSPYIEVVRNRIHDELNVFKNDMNAVEDLNHVQGFVSVNNIVLNSGATVNEKNRITTLLRQGVFIK